MPGAVTFPEIPLKGGPYDGETAQGNNPERPTTYFPGRVVMYGPDGAAVYAIEAAKNGRVGKFSHMGTE